MTTLLLGMGNPILRDDAVGVRLARDFASRLDGVPGLHVEAECQVGGLNLLDVLQGHERAIVLDSVETRDPDPGTWHHFNAGALRETVNLTCIHDANFATALELGRRLGIPLPRTEEIHLFVVEIEDGRTFSETMSAALEERYPEFASEIFERIESILASPTEVSS